MADEWIKLRRNLGHHPKIVRMMSALLADRFRIIGGLHAVWSVFDEFSEDGKLNGYSYSTMDIAIGWPGFCEAMGAVEWLTHDGQSLVVPEFDEHNGQSGKRRAQDAKRKRNVRKVSAKCPHPKRTKSGLEEEVEEEIDKSKEPTPLPPSGARPKVKPVPDGFESFWATYPRREGKAGAIKAFAKLNAADVAAAMVVLPRWAQYWRLRNEPQFIPHPATWLNGRRWEDEIPSPPQLKPQPESRQVRALRALEEISHDPRYTDTARRHAALDGRPPGLAAPRDARATLDACAGSLAGDVDGLDGCPTTAWPDE